MTENNSGISTRRVAFGVLHQVLLQKQPLDQVLDRDEQFNALEGRDRGFTRMMIATVLRYMGVMDVLLLKLQDEPREIKPLQLKIILYIGIVQMIYMNVPDHAAIDTTVTLSEREGMPKKKAFVNAILRRLQREGNTPLDKIDPVQAAVPEWLLATWVKDYGLKEAANIAQALLVEASLDISIKKSEEVDYWAGELDASVLPIGSLRLQEAGNVTSLSGFDDGQWWVQDASAALPVKLIGDLNGKSVVDLCAAPGGKTAQLAAQGAQVIALDRSAKRLERLKENMARLALEDNVDVVVSDGAAWETNELVDAVLLDAPCSATGTIRRHPDVMHLKSQKDVDQLRNIQMRLLENSVNMLKSGGTLIYCTCSLQKSEGEEQIDAFLSGRNDIKRVPVIAEELNGLSEAITDKGDVRILPYYLATQGGMDGFFISRLVKK